MPVVEGDNRDDEFRGIAQRSVESIANAANVDIAFGALGAWVGTTPEGLPVLLLDAGTHDIYALDWDAP